MRRALLIAGLLFLGLAVAGGWVWSSLYLPYQGFAAPGVYVDVPRGASSRTIARLLANQGVVRNRWVFEALSRRSRRTLQAGEYYFDHPVTALEVFDTVADGRVYVRELVIPEGYSMFDIADLVAREDFLSRDDFLAAASDPAPIRDLAPNAKSLEGFLFPATYGFPRHPSGQAMVDAMVKRFRQEWSTISEQPPPAQQPNAQQPYAQPSSAQFPPLEKVVTLASLVERETPIPDERPLVAGVFANRLRQGVPLQCDPTVVYALELAGQYTGTLEAREIPFDSPYNTYRHTGLPPGPIANPGEASLRAAMAPTKTDYLYFVANTEGGHFFSKTLEEHNRNVAKYRQRLAAERNAAHSPDSAPPGPERGHAQKSP
jgi:UPF0755 protein